MRIPGGWMFKIKSLIIGEIKNRGANVFTLRSNVKLPGEKQQKENALLPLL